MERGVLKIGKFQATDDGYFIFILKFILYMVVGLSIIGIPDFLSMKFSAEELSQLNNSSSTFALGATILLAGFKNKIAAIESVSVALKDHNKTLRELTATTEELQEALENHNKAIKAHKEILFELAEIKRELEYLKNNQEVAATKEE